MQRGVFLVAGMGKKRLGDFKVDAAKRPCLRNVAPPAYNVEGMQVGAHEPKAVGAHTSNMVFGVESEGSPPSPIAALFE